MISALAWTSNETSPRLTAMEVEELFNFSYELSKIGELNGKFKHASTVVYWQRLKGEN